MKRAAVVFGGSELIPSIKVSFLVKEKPHTRSPAMPMQIRNVPTARELILFCTRNGVV